ncbi:MAG TPA: copper resistance CopC family protein [Casimicrobiaceae bacterium]|nr:copper resistance CopC family protein [Casimicrobiaceae bacterium]
MPLRSDNPRSRKALLATLAIAVLAATLAADARAHAYLDRAQPVAGSVVRESPRELTLWFTQRVEPAFSEVRVLDAAGKQVSAGALRFDPANGKVLRVSLPVLGAGTYHVKWRILAVDTHVSEGEFTFDVAP